MDNKDTYENKIELKDTAPDINKVPDVASGSEYQSRKVTQNKKREIDTPWGSDCKNWDKHDWRKSLAFIGNIQEGVYRDVQLGRNQGEKRPAEFWARVWTEIHESGGGPPANLAHEVLREKWAEHKNSGRSHDEIWEEMEKKYPVVFILVPLLQRWYVMGQGEPSNNVDLLDGLETYNNIMFYIPDDTITELKDKYGDMKKDGKEEDFWKENWDRVHGLERLKSICDENSKTKKAKDKTDFDWEKWILPQRKINGFGENVIVAPEYHKCYPLGYEFYRRIRRSADERPIYKQFDFWS